MRRWIPLVALAMLACGCQTTQSFSGGCPGVYSGLRYYGDQLDALPADGKLFYTLDLPLSAIADTLLLPFTAFAEPDRPEHGWLPGCRWARP